MLLVGNAESRDLHRIARKCSETGGRCRVSGQKHFHPTTSVSRSKLSFFTGPHPPSPVVFRDCHGSHHERAPFPENTTFALKWKIMYSTRQRLLIWELLTLRRLVDQNQGLMEYLLQWLAQIALVAFLTQASGQHDENRMRYIHTGKRRSETANEEQPD